MRTDLLNFVAEIDAYDPALGAARTLRFATRGFTTDPSATPANTFYDGRITQPLDVARTLFSSRATQGKATLAYGQLVLDNADGSLDRLADYAFDGRAITLRATTDLTATDPSAFGVTFVGRMQTATFSMTAITITVRDRLYDISQAPLQTARYGGTNALPDGLDGTADDLSGKPKPVLIGKAYNVVPPCVNTSKLIYQVHDGSTSAAVDRVRDRGVELDLSRAWSSVATINGSTAVNSDITKTAFGFGGGVWVYASEGGNLYTSSDNGVTWTLRNSSIGNGKAFAYGNGVWLVFTSTNLYRSTNGTSFSSASLPASATWVSCVWSSDLSLFIAGSSVGEITTSPDGVTWTARGAAVSGSTLAIGQLTTGFGMVIGQTLRRIITSYDGITWTTRLDMLADGFPGNLSAVCASDSLAVATATQGTFMSPDGLHWTKVLTFGAGQPVVFSRFFMAATFSALRLSRDGIEWTDSLIRVPGLFNNGLMAVNGDTVIALNALNDQFIVLTPMSYTSESDLLDREPMPGEYAVYEAGGYFRLGSSPDGVITADAHEASGDVTAADAYITLLERAGLDTGDADDFASADATALDAANDAPVGVWSMADGATCASVIDQVAPSVGASWFPDADGVFHIARLEAPTGTPSLVILPDQVLRLERVSSSDPNNGIPVYRVDVRYGRNYSPLSDVAGAVGDVDRAALVQEWRVATAKDESILIAHPSAQILSIDTVLVNASDAQAEATRLLTLRQIQRELYEATIPMTSETAAIDLNAVIELQHGRYALSVVGSPSGWLTGGGLFRVLGVAPNAKDRTIVLTLWGRSQFANRVTSTGAFRVTSTGAFRVRSRAA